MWIETIFYLVFLSQVVLISYYYPSKILARMNYIIQHYSADKYAKLYPNGYEKTLEKKLQYKWLNHLILLAGLGIFTTLVIASLQRDTGLRELDVIPFAFGVVQAIPFILLELSALKHLKVMRQQYVATKRQAELSPRNIFNYVSPMRVFVTFFMLVLCVYLIFSFSSFNWSFDVATLIGTLLLCNGLFIGLGYTLLQGKKLDPYQSPEDRKRMTTAAFHSYTSVSILVSLFLILNRLVNHYSLDSWEPLFNSLYFQAVFVLSMGTMLKSMLLEDINFEVYKGSTTTTG